MDNRPGLGTDFAVGVDVGHDVVPQTALVLFGGGEVDIVDMRLELRDLFGRDRETHFGLRFRQRHPQRRQVLNFRCGPHSSLIRLEA